VTIPEIPAIQDLSGIHLIDTRHMGNSGTVGIFVVPAEDGFLLIETGPGATLGTLLAGIESVGYEPAQLKAILVTHIHLDHAGAAGALAQLSGAPVYVHERGARHLADPSRLLESASRIYGELMDTLWGEMRPVSEAQLRPLSGGETLDMAGRQLQVLYTPGHASHHISYLLDDGAMFTGDAAGIKLTGSAVIRPALPPPEVDLEAWETSLKAMMAANPMRLLLTHFGQVDDALAHLRQVALRNKTWAEEILKGMQLGEDDAALIERISRLGDQELAQDNAHPEVIMRHRLTSNYQMTVMGVTRYWQKRQPERLGGKKV
jgi:glyoxylase-like metal-dependent hydrolase (beta-lactamase superfamily II)